MENDKFRLNPHSCPCKTCDHHAPGCHTIQCGPWWEWNKYMEKRRAKRWKEAQERQRWWLFRKESLLRAKSRKSSQKYAIRKRGDTET